MKFFLVSIYTIAIYLIGLHYSMQVTRTVLDGKKIKKWRGTVFPLISSVLSASSPAQFALLGFYSSVMQRTRASQY